MNRGRHHGRRDDASGAREGLTRADLDATPGDGHRHELIDGVILVSAAPWPGQRRIVLRLAELLHSCVPARSSTRSRLLSTSGACCRLGAGTRLARGAPWGSSRQGPPADESVPSRSSPAALDGRIKTISFGASSDLGGRRTGSSTLAQASSPRRSSPGSWWTTPTTEVGRVTGGEEWTATVPFRGHDRAERPARRLAPGRLAAPLRPTSPGRADGSVRTQECRRGVEIDPSTSGPTSPNCSCRPSISRNC